MKPWIINNAQLILIYTLNKTSCFYGRASGSGIVISRLPTQHQALVQWSAPLFIKINSKSFGISFGKQSSSTFAVANSPTAKNAFTAPSGRHFKGLDFNFVAGSSLRERSDVVSNNFINGDIGFLGVSKIGGVALDLSFFVDGAVTVDSLKCHAVYGNSATPAQVLTMPGPPEFQPLYGEFSRVVSTVERTSPFNPARTSASLERFSSGLDPERVMVMPNGRVFLEEKNFNGSA
jgi:lipid-binding SYLF domain-containing protein